jgi:CheY-like chemotaxis protein
MEERRLVGNSGPVGQVRSEWMTIHEGSRMIGKSIGQIGAQMGYEIVGLRRKDVDCLQPAGEIVAAAGDQLLAIAEFHSVAATDPLTMNSKKIVLVDDNPVIVRLCARLFQQAGFEPLAADSGDTGLALILAEKPAAAVVDFMLPKISGLEVCRRVRQTFPDGSMKLVVFTADDTRRLREKCLQAGADEVIVKSAELTEIVSVVAGLIGL